MPLFSLQSLHNPNQGLRNIVVKAQRSNIGTLCLGHYLKKDGSRANEALDCLLILAMRFERLSF
jgi:hypothetical protein